MVPTHTYAFSSAKVEGVPEGYDINLFTLSESNGTVAVAWNGHQFELITGTRMERDGSDSQNVRINIAWSTESKEELMLSLIHI